MPVSVNMRRIQGSLRLRVQLDPSVPFMRRGTFCFTQMPRLNLAVHPLRDTLGGWAIDAMKLPGLNTYVLRSIYSVCSRFLIPDSYTLDLDRLLVGDLTVARTQALGVLMIVIHSAHGLHSSDTNGLSDPYCTLGFSKINKTIVSTRTVTKDLNPVFEERFFLLIARDALSAGEKLRISVSDSDRFTIDDTLGFTDIPLVELTKATMRASEHLRYPGVGEATKRMSNLRPSTDSQICRGRISWSYLWSPLEEEPPNVKDYPTPRPECRKTGGGEEEVVSGNPSRVKPVPFEWEKERLQV